MMTPKQISIPGKQRGQSMVFILLFTSVTLLSVVLLYNTGQLSREKMELQNAADALSYSEAVLEARAMNFIAYTNRAKVANEVFIGQLTAFETWGARYQEAPNAPVLGPISAIPFVGGAIAAAIRATLTPFAVMGRAASRVSGRVSDRIIPIIANLNRQLWSVGQRAFRLATVAAQVEIVKPVISTNAPGSELSVFGAATSVQSGVEFSGIFLQDNEPQKSDTTSKNALRKFAGVVNSSGDAWINDRSRSDLQVNLGILAGGYDTAGGSELRFVNSGGREYYNWSSLDTIEGFLRVGISGFSFRFPLPLGGASKQWRSGNKSLPAGPAGWKSNADHYGSAWQKTPASANLAVTIHRPLPPARYRGLSAYTGINENTYNNVYQGPAFVVGLKKRKDKIRVTDNTDIKDAVTTSGSLAVNTATTGGSSLLEKDPSLFVLSAGEAYYKRPGSNEYANLFSPYWEARLTEVDNSTKKFAAATQTFNWNWLIP